MRKTLLSIAICFCALASAFAQSQDLFRPYQSTDLRAPSVPLIVSDPYFSIWSPYDRLNDGVTRLWTNDEKPIQGWITVDGVKYCFMGADPEVFQAIAPMADAGGWKARYTREVQADGWQQPGFNDASWKEGTAPTSVGFARNGEKNTPTCMCAAR